MPRSVIDSGQIHESAVDPTVNYDVTAGYNYGSEVLNTVTKTLFKCLDATEGVAVWQQEVGTYELATVSDNNAEPVEFIPSTMNNYALFNLIDNLEHRANDSNPVFFNPRGQDYIECTSAAYDVRANIVYRGTEVWTPNTLIVMTSKSKATGTGYFRVYDYDNAQEICERTVTDKLKTTHVFTLTPTETARFQVGIVALEFQLKAVSSKLYLHAAGLYSL